MEQKALYQRRKTFGLAALGLVVHTSFTAAVRKRRDVQEFVRSLMVLIEARDANLKAHSEHVERLAALLYDNLSPWQRLGVRKKDLHYAALLHDIGKLGVPEAILNKPGCLSATEREVMMVHPEVGVEIIEPMHAFARISPWILYHHERMDGQGYHKIKGSAIPLGARMIAVADVFSALYMRRPYHMPASYEECIEMLKSEAPHHLDPALVRAFCQIPKEEVIAAGLNVPGHCAAAGQAQD